MVSMVPFGEHFSSIWQTRDFVAYEKAFLRQRTFCCPTTQIYSLWAGTRQAEAHAL
jgi:hypothetical protein